MNSVKRESLANVARLRERVDRQRLSAVVVRSGQNFTYLSGLAYPGTLARHLDLTDSARGVLLVWPRDGEPVVVLNKIAEGLTRRDSRVDRIEVYEAYNESPYQRLAQVLKALGLAHERVGFERSYVSAAHWEEVQRELPHLTMVDCSAMMDEVRWVKTEAEIRLIKKGADLLDDAYLEVFPTIRPGETERAVHSRLIASCLRRGANWAHGILNSSRNLIPYAGESDGTFERGDVVRTDYVAYLDGYPGHQSRNAVMGKPSVAQVRDYHITRGIYGRTIDRCRPGVAAGEVAGRLLAVGQEQRVARAIDVGERDLGRCVEPAAHIRAVLAPPRREETRTPVSVESFYALDDPVGRKDLVRPGGRDLDDLGAKVAQDIHP